MEKIYMENEKKSKKPSFFKKLFNDKGSMVAIIVVSLVCVVGLVIFGFSQISFAAGELEGTLPSSFVSTDGSSVSGFFALYGSTASGQRVMPYYGHFTETEKIPFFCIEYDTEYQNGKTYRPGAQIEDQGLIYLMSQLYPNNKVSEIGKSEVPSDVVQSWFTQMAIWVYLYEEGAANNTTLNSNKYYDNLKLVTSLEQSNGTYVISRSQPLFDSFGVDGVSISNLIKRAHDYKDNLYPVKLSVVKNSDRIAITNDGEYYQTDLVSVVGSALFEGEEFNSYSVDLSAAPDGTLLVDEEGNVYEDVTNMSPTSKFYVRVPADKVTDENKILGINIQGNFTMYGANEYVASGCVDDDGNSVACQKVINVKLRPQSVNAPLDIQLDYTPEVPNTGISAVQTIYFIGIIILLSGVGIIYANTRPKKSQ